MKAASWKKIRNKVNFVLPFGVDVKDLPDLDPDDPNTLHFLTMWLEPPIGMLPDGRMNEVGEDEPPTDPSEDKYAV